MHSLRPLRNCVVSFQSITFRAVKTDTFQRLSFHLSCLRTHCAMHISEIRNCREAQEWPTASGRLSCAYHFGFFMLPVDSNSTNVITPHNSRRPDTQNKQNYHITKDEPIQYRKKLDADTKCELLC